MRGPACDIAAGGSKGAHVDVGLVSQTSYRALPGVLYEGVPGASYAIVSGAPYGAAPGKSYGPWQSCVCTSCLYHSSRGVAATSDGVAPGASDGAVPGAPHRGVPSLHERDEEGADLRRKTCWAASKKKPARWGGTAKGVATTPMVLPHPESSYENTKGVVATPLLFSREREALNRTI